MEKRKRKREGLLLLSSAVLLAWTLSSQSVYASEFVQPQVEHTSVGVAEVTTVEIGQPILEETSRASEDSPAISGETLSTEASISVATEEKVAASEPVAEDKTDMDTTETVTDTVVSLSVEQPLSKESNAIVNTQPLWDSNIKGQGMVVAVIDTGLDVDHDVLHISDMTKAKYQKPEDIERAKQEAGIGYGKWYSDKVVFGYNYADSNDILKQKDVESHGMHVAGIAVGNPTKSHSSGDYIYGVAPEAQLMFMRVFSDKTGGGTSPFLYARAIEDAIKLGADTINLSLGSANGILNDTAKTIEAAIKKANEAGITVVIAGGNDTAFGEGHANPDADKPDYGLVGDPSAARDSLSVASYNNTHVTNEVLTINGAETTEVVFSRPNLETPAFDATKHYNYVFVGKGTENDFATSGDVTGKIVVIERGDITFGAKVENAQRHQAAGVIIFNNTDGDAHSVRMTLTEEATKIPSLFIDRKSGQLLVSNAADGKYTITVDGKYRLESNPKANRMSDFSSWGLTADGELKPDITAPGGDIFSSINDNKYGTMGGTSMAAPHVAGLSVLVKQVLAERFPNIKGKELSTLIKHLLMSTAVPHINDETKAHTSPRQQGAGIANVSKAAHSDFYLTGDEGLSSISLGNVGETFTFNVTIHNLSDQEKVVKYVTDVNTDQVENGKVTLKPRKLAEFAGETITVSAKGSVTVPISVNTAQFTKELTELMTNGYYLEGFVRFLNTEDDGELVSLPYVGFKGKFQDLAIIEKPVYDYKPGENPFYTDLTKVTSYTQEEDSHYTAVLIGEKEFNHLTNSYTDTLGLTAGAFKDENGNYVIRRDADGNPIIAISPNGDGNRDALAFRGTFLRNYKELRIAIYKAEDTAFETPLWISDKASGDKNYYSSNPSNPKSTLIDTSEWAGRDSEGKLLPDGKYKYVVEHYSVVPGAQKQRLVFDVVLDTSTPVVVTGVYDEATRRFKPRATKEEGVGVYREQMYYVLDKFYIGDEAFDDSFFITDPTRKEYIKKNADGTYTIPEKDLYDRPISDENIWFMVEDFAGNTMRTNLAEFKMIGNTSGVVNVRLMDNKLNMSLDMLGYRYSIKDEAGNVVTDSTSVGRNLHILPFGTYTVELILFDEEYAKLLDNETVKTIVVDENHTELAVDFATKLVLYSTLTVDFDTELPAGVQVYAIDSNGNRTVLTKGRYITDVFEKRLVYNEKYTIVVETPKGYFVAGEDMTADMVENHVVKVLSLWAKGDIEQDGKALELETKPEIDLTADPDQDGFTTEEELKGQSDPFDGTSVPEVSETGAGVTADAKPEIDLASDTDQDGFTTEEELKGQSDPFDTTSVPFIWETGTGVTASEKPIISFETEKKGHLEYQPLSVSNTKDEAPADVETVSHTPMSEKSLNQFSKSLTKEALPKTGQTDSFLTILCGTMVIISAMVVIKLKSKND
ncbi:S8 family serine peptidase [Streptococcus hillyeri]